MRSTSSAGAMHSSPTSGPLAAALVRGDPAIARSARAAAEVLLNATKK